MTLTRTLIPFLALTVACGGGLRLAPGVPVTQAITIDKPHLYRIALEAGDSVELDLDEDGASLGLVLESPDGSQIVAVDTPNGPFGRERLFAVAEVSGEHWVAVKLNGHVGGSFTLRAEVRRASEEDRRRALACRLLYESWFAGDTSPEAQAAGEKAHALWDELDEAYLATVALLRLGGLHAKRGESERAVARFRQARERLESLETRDLEPDLLHAFAVSLERSNDWPKARETLEKALESAREQRQVWTEATILNDLGYLLYRHRTRIWFALGLLDRALEIFQTLKDATQEAITRHNRGLILNWLGHEDEAIREYELALQLPDGLPDDAARARTVLEIGWALMWQGHEKEAENRMREALTLLGSGNLDARVTALDRLGTLYLRQGRTIEARQAYMDALDALGNGSDPIDRAPVLNNLGRVELELGDLPRAFAVFDEALALFSAASDRSGEAYTLANRARGLLRRADLHGAQKDLERALSLHEGLREDTRSPGFRSSYVETIYGHFQLYVDVLMELEDAEPGRGWAIRALEAVERSRARSLLDLLAELGSRRERATGQSGLLAEKARLEQRVRMLEAEKRRLRSTRAPLEEVSEVTRLLRDLGLDLEYLEGVATIPLTEPRRLEELRRALDPDTSLLVYSLGEQQGFVWLVGPEGLRSWRKLESWGRVADRLRPLVEALGNPNELRSDGTWIDQELARLGETLLPSTALPRRLVVIPDGALHYLPFGALRVDGKYLIEGHEVSRLPSASVLLALRERRLRQAPASTLLAVIADPVFAPDDPRFSSQAAAAARAYRRNNPSGLDGLSRLLQSGAEADVLTARVAEGCRWQARGFGATVESAHGDRLAQASLLHFATHALLEDGSPELSQIALSQFDQTGRPRSGSLYAFEIAQLDLVADLVVLSACRTALGLEIRGEGLVGLPQSFFEAGADRVLVSLWNVDDTATAELMESFYHGLLNLRLSPPEALRRAQQQLRSSELWSEPYYWAAFTLIGEWRELPSTLLDSPCLHR